MRLIYSSLRGIKLKDTIVKDIAELDEMYYNWIITNGIKLITNETESETKACTKLKNEGISFEKQVAFVKGRKCYYADIFIPEYNFVVEIDGGSHKDKAKYDKSRDGFFSSFGIKTIRVTNEDVVKPKFINKVLHEIAQYKAKIKRASKCW